MHVLFPPSSHFINCPVIPVPRARAILIAPIPDDIVLDLKSMWLLQVKVVNVV